MPAEAAVLLIMESSPRRTFIAAKLRALGCEVFCADDVDQAATLVRGGLPRNVLLLHLGLRQMSSTALHAEMAKRLPGWSVAPLDVFDVEDEPEDSGPTRSTLN